MTAGGELARHSLQGLISVMSDEMARSDVTSFRMADSHLVDLLVLLANALDALIASSSSASAAGGDSSRIASDPWGFVGSPALRADIVRHNLELGTSQAAGPRVAQFVRSGSAAGTSSDPNADFVRQLYGPTNDSMQLIHSVFANCTSMLYDNSEHYAVQLQ